ncbi:MAG: hypothetical protein ACRDWG_14580, partial [Actinomycetes bacterium]
MASTPTAVRSRLPAFAYGRSQQRNASVTEPSAIRARSLRRNSIELAAPLVATAQQRDSERAQLAASEPTGNNRILV